VLSLPAIVMVATAVRGSTAISRSVASRSRLQSALAGGSSAAASEIGRRAAAAGGEQGEAGEARAWASGAHAASYPDGRGRGVPQ
jgi:hypothetical protein